MRSLTEKQQRRRANYLAHKRDRKRIGDIKGNKPARDQDYLDWLATQPCLLGARGKCLCFYARRPFAMLNMVEAAHSGPHGMGVKASDYDAIPLCGYQHREAKEAQGKRKTWFEDHGIDRDVAIADLHRRYESLTGKRITV